MATPNDVDAILSQYAPAPAAPAAGGDVDAILAQYGGGAPAKREPTPGTPESYGTDAAPNPAGPEPENKVAGMARDLLGMDLHSRFSLNNLREALTEGGGIPSRQPTGTPPVGPAPDKLTRDAGPMAEDWGANAIVGGLVGGAAGKLAAPLGRIAAGAIEGGVGSKVQGGSATSGAGIGALLASLGPLGRAIQQSRGGMARNFIEANNGDVGIDTPGRGKPFDEMVTKGTTDADIGQQAAVSSERGLDIHRGEHDAVRGGIARGEGNIEDSPAAQARRPVTDLVTNIQDAIDHLATAPTTRANLREQLALINSKQPPGYNPQIHEPTLTESDINAIRRSLDREGRTGISTDEAKHPLRSAADNARDMVDQGPFGPTNKAYSAEYDRYQRGRRQLGVNERPHTPEEKKTTVDRVTNLITRRGQNTVTAGKQIDDLEAFARENPEAGAEFAKPGMLRAKGDLSFGVLPRKHGGLIDRTSSAIGTGAALDAAASAMGHGIGGHAASIGGLAAALTLRNLPAIEGRILAPAAKYAAKNEQHILRLNPLFQAALARKEDQ